MNRFFLSWTLWAGTLAGGAELSVQSPAATPGHDCESEISYVGKGAAATDVQFDIEFDAGTMSIAGVAAAAAQRARKTVNQSTIEVGKARFLVTGLNDDILADGVLVVLKISVKSTAKSGVYVLKVTNAAASDRTAKAVSVNGLSGTVVVR